MTETSSSAGSNDAVVITEEAMPNLTPLSPEHAEAIRRLLAAGEQRGIELHQLQQVAASLSRLLDEESLLDEVARSAWRALGGDGVIVATATAGTHALATRRHAGADGNRPLITLPCDEGALSTSLLAGGPSVLSRARAGDAPVIDAATVELPGVQALLVVPMMQGHTLLGALVAYASSPSAFEAKSREFLVTIAITAGTALRNARLHAESERDRRQSDAMAEVARAAGESLRVAEVERLIMRHAMALLQSEGACVVVRDGDYLLIEAALGIAAVLAGVVIPVQGSLSGRVVRTGEVYIGNDVGAESEAYRRNLALVAVRRAVIVPLRTARGTIGALAVYNREDPFHAEDARILQRLADQVTVAIVNSRLFTDIQEATREWSSTFDALGVGMAVVNEERRVLRCNARARQLSGDTAPVGLIGRPLYTALLGVETVDGPDPLRDAIELGVRARARCRRADGTRTFDIHAAPHQDGGAVVTFDEVDG